MVFIAFSILCISAAYFSLSRDHHGVARRPGSLTNDLCQTDGNSSRDTASLYRAIACANGIHDNQWVGMLWPSIYLLLSERSDLNHECMTHSPEGPQALGILLYSAIINSLLPHQSGLVLSRYPQHRDKT